MRWATRSHIHLDRAATPWLITRFVDPEAEFAFLDWNSEAVASDGVVLFGVPGVRLSAHDENGTCFRKVIEEYGLDDPALEAMERVIASGVSDAIGVPPPENQTERERILGSALNNLGLGLGVAFEDERHLRAAMDVYEALYVCCQLNMGTSEVLQLPGSWPEQIAQLRASTARG